MVQNLATKDWGSLQEMEVWCSSLPWGQLIQYITQRIVAEPWDSQYKLHVWRGECVELKKLTEGKMSQGR